MNCEKCLVEKRIFSCMSCHTGYYCSKECQKEDWKTHKKFCKLWGKSGVFNNPFFTNSITTSPKKLPNLDLDTRFINYSRGRQGETMLHNAVIDGDKEKIISLIKQNAFVNCYDYRMSTPLYYSCSHPGKDNILTENNELRKEIVKILLDNGAFPFARSGFSGMLPSEAAETYKFNDVSKLIQEHKYYKTWNLIKNNFNQSTPPENISKLVKKYYDIHWRSQSTHWLFALGRENMCNLIPHPKVLENVNKGDISQSIENLFIDCSQRLLILISLFENIDL